MSVARQDLLLADARELVRPYIPSGVWAWCPTSVGSPTLPGACAEVARYAMAVLDQRGLDPHPELVRLARGGTGRIPCRATAALLHHLLCL